MRNNIYDDLNRASKIVSDFNTEISIITNKYLEVEYSTRYTESLINDFKNRNEKQSTIPKPFMRNEMKLF